MRGYIYVITNSINGMQYIGQTINSIKNRYHGHKMAAKSNRDNMYIHKAMNKYGVEYFNVEEVTCIECDTKEDLLNELNFLEQHYIVEYNTLTPNGYNLTRGGAKCAEWQKKKVDEYDLFGKFVRTYESIISAVRENGFANNSSILKCCAGKSSHAYKRVWRYHDDPLDKYPLPDITIAERNNKMAPVDQYTKDGIFIQTYESITFAYQMMDMQYSSHISECCEGKLHTAHGYIWRYHGDSFDKNRDKRFTACAQYDLDGNFIAKYNSIQDACIAIGKDPKKHNSHISSCCRGTRNTAYGYKWKYI